MIVALAAAAMALAAVGAGCGGDDDDDGGGGGELTAALALSGTSEDRSYALSNVNAIEAVEEELGADVSVTELIPPAQFARALSGFGREGVDVVFAGGTEFQEPTSQVAGDFPDTTYVCVTCTETGTEPENVVNLDIAFNEAGYLAGVAAGAATKTNKVGNISGFDFPDVVEGAEGFRAGAEAENPQVEVDNQYIATFSEPSKARAAADTMLGQDVDVIRHEAAGAGAGVFDAVDGTDAWVIGTFVDQRELSPTNTLTSAVVDFAKGYVEIAELYQDDELTERTYLYDVKNGGVSLTPINEELENASDVQARVDEVRQQIVDGEIDIPQIREAQ
jgi:basic membrane lipoprotein Med (substrate-binding protein (PBP1-ABC) superfamily)